MHSWLRVGKRFDYTIAVVAIASFFGAGFLLTRTAPSEIRWIVWIVTASLIFPIWLAGCVVGRWVRRRDNEAPPPTTGTHRPVRVKNRIKLYLVLAIVTAVSATAQTKIFLSRHLFYATTADVFLWNFAALAVLVAIYELIEWRMQRSSTRSEP
jgi:hypothetical protein